MNIKFMRRLSILFVIGVIWSGFLCTDFIMAKGYHITHQGQSESICSGVDNSENDNCHLLHHAKQSDAIIAFNNFNPTVSKVVNSLPTTSLQFPSKRSQIRWELLEFKLVNRNRLTGTVIKLE
jgi:hypothetical protein